MTSTRCHSDQSNATPPTMMMNLYGVVPMRYCSVKPVKTDFSKYVVPIIDRQRKSAEFYLEASAI